MKVHDLKPAPGSKTPQAAGSAAASAGKGGKTAGRGTKGQGARSTVKPGFEGGQTPLHPPHARSAKGFKNPFRIEYTSSTSTRSRRFDAGAEVTPETLRAAGPGRTSAGLVKVLGRGEITKPLTVAAHAFSEAADAAIEAAGGTDRELPLPFG